MLFRSGQLLAFHMGLFHMNKTATILAAMLVLVALVDALSYASTTMAAKMVAVLFM